MEVKIDDTSAFGMPDHDHSKHRVYVQGLTYWEACKLQASIELMLGPQEFDSPLDNRTRDEAMGEMEGGQDSIKDLDNT